MRGKIVRVRRRHARSKQWALVLLVISLVIYLLSAISAYINGDDSEARSAVTEQSAAANPVSAAVEQVTEEVRFLALSAHLIELGSFDNADSARIEAARYVRRGAAGYVLEAAGRFSVIGALYSSAEDAEAVAKRLTEREQIASRVITMDGPAVALRVTASEMQITALVEGEKSLRNLTDQLQKLGSGLDNGQVSQESAVQQIQLIHAEAQLRLRALERALGGDEHPVMRALMLQLQALSDATNSLGSADESMLSFSAKIKYNGIAMRLRQIDFLRNLAA